MICPHPQQGQKYWIASGKYLVMNSNGLFGIGSVITLFSGRSIWFPGARQDVFGLIAAAITFGIGS